MDNLHMDLPQFPARPYCTICDLHESAKHPGIATIYERSLAPTPLTPAVIFIGQNPGYDEDIFNEPFVGRSGVQIRGGTLRKMGNRIEACRPSDAHAVTIPNGAYIDGIGLRSLASIYLTNIVRCTTLRNATPTASQCKSCFPYTRIDIETIMQTHHSAPVCLLFISAPAVAAVYKHLFKRKVNQNQSFTLNGTSILHPTLRRPLHLFSTYHPAYELRNHNARIAIQNHLLLLRDFLLGKKPLSTTPTIITPRGPSP